MAVVTNSVANEKINDVDAARDALLAPHALSTVAASGAAVTLTLDDIGAYKVTLTANCTFTFSGAPFTGTVGSFLLLLVQDATGGRTATWPASVKWPAGSAVDLTDTAARGDLLEFITFDGGTTWQARTLGLDFVVA